MDRRAVVYELLERWGNKPAASIRETDRILDDISMDGDDYGMSFVPELQERLGFKASRKEWETIVTVGDLVRLVEQHLGRR
jgi:acyl carrier protein